MDRARQASQPTTSALTGSRADGGGWHDTVTTRTPHDKQRLFIDSTAKRKVIRAGRRGGKTTGIAIYAVQRFLAGRRVLYATPTQEQIDAFWFEVTTALTEPIERGLLYKNETKHIIEVPGTKNRIRAKTAWNADTLRGDYADDLILDEWQLMSEDAWDRVGAPMLIDNDGDAVFIYTPPSLRSISASKAKDPFHAPKLFKSHADDATGRWATFHFSSHDNPHISAAAIDELAGDMTAAAYSAEILAIDSDETPGALWKRTLLDDNRVRGVPEGVTLTRVVIGVDPPGGRTECGIVVAGLGSDGAGYVLADYSLQDSPANWSAAVIGAYEEWGADRVVGESNYGGDMVESTIRSAEGGTRISYKAVQATRGKAVRAEPVAAQYERGRVHHVGAFERLEYELCNWLPNSGMTSPNRMDALVWTLTELMLGGPPKRSATW